MNSILILSMLLFSCSKLNLIANEKPASQAKIPNAEDAKRDKLEGIKNEKNPWGYTSLMDAANKGDAQLIKQLITLGAQINEEDDLGDTALFYAVRAKKRVAVKLLLSNGADVDHKNKSGNTVFTSTKNKQIIQILQKIK